MHARGCRTRLAGHWTLAPRTLGQQQCDSTSRLLHFMCNTHDLSSVARSRWGHGRWYLTLVTRHSGARGVGGGRFGGGDLLAIPDTHHFQVRDLPHLVCRVPLRNRILPVPKTSHLFSSTTQGSLTIAVSAPVRRSEKAEGGGEAEGCENRRGG